MMTVFIVILVTECQWGSLWRVFGVEVELAWCKIMLRLGHAHPMDHLIMLGIKKNFLQQIIVWALSCIVLNPTPLVTYD